MDQETVKQGRNSWQWAKHAWLYSDLLQALKQEPLTTLGNDIMNKMDVNSASTAPYCGDGKGTELKKGLQTK